MAVMDTRGMISCWTPTEVSQSNGRVPWPFAQAGSYSKVVMGFPKLLFGDGPKSPFAAGFSGSPTGVTVGSPACILASSAAEGVHVLAMLLVAAMTGLTAWVLVSASCRTKRLTVALMAVFPVPNTSHETPSRG